MKTRHCIVAGLGLGFALSGCNTPATCNAILTDGTEIAATFTKGGAAVTTAQIGAIAPAACDLATAALSSVAKKTGVAATSATVAK